MNRVSNLFHTIRPNGLAEEISLPGIIVTASAPPWRFGPRRGGRLHDFGAGADTAVGKFDVHLHAGRNRTSRAQRPAGAIAHQRKPARQYTAIRERREQLSVAFAPRPARIKKIVDGAPGALGERVNAFAFTRDPHAMRRNIRRDACPQPQRSAGIAVTAALNLHAQEMHAQTPADTGEAHAMDVRIGP